MKTYILKDEKTGKVRGHLEPNSGIVYDESGSVVERMTPTGEYDEKLADYANAYYHANIAKQVGAQVPMKTRDGSHVFVSKDLGISDVHISAALPNMAQGYTLADGVADIAAPAVVVSKDSNKYFTWDAQNAFRRVLPNAAGPGGAVPEVNATLSSSSYSTVPYALAGFVTSEVQANADSPLRPLAATLNRIMNALLLEREIRVATMLQTSGNWDSSVVQTLVAAAKWNGGASADPVAVLHTAIEASALPVTGIVMSELVAHDFQRNAQVQKYTGYKQGISPIPSMSEFAAVLQLPPMYVARMKYWASGTTLSYVWGNHVVLLHSPPQNPPTSQDDAATAYTFRWNGGDAPDGSVSGGFMVRSYFDPKRGPRGGNVVVALHNDAEKITANNVGGLILNAHA